MEPLIVIFAVIAAVFVGRFWQWRRDRHARRFAYHTAKAQAAMDEMTAKRRAAEARIRRITENRGK